MHDFNNDVDNKNIWKSNNEGETMARSQISDIVHIFCYSLTINLYIF